MSIILKNVTTLCSMAVAQQIQQLDQELASVNAKVETAQTSYDNLLEERAAAMAALRLSTANGTAADAKSKVMLQIQCKALEEKRDLRKDRLERLQKEKEYLLKIRQVIMANLGEFSGAGLMVGASSLVFSTFALLLVENL